MSSFTMARSILCDERLVLASAHETLSTALDHDDLPGGARADFVSAVHFLGLTIGDLDSVLSTLEAAIKKVSHA